MFEYVGKNVGKHIVCMSVRMWVSVSMWVSMSMWPKMYMSVGMQVVFCVCLGMGMCICIHCEYDM